MPIRGKVSADQFASKVVLRIHNREKILCLMLVESHRGILEVSVILDIVDIVDVVDVDDDVDDESENGNKLRFPIR